ncbi:MAG: ABC transporter permease [Anaerolineaceae bacterium]|nr:ABC transporter permease [Anaerolineaceae bacterium]MCB9097971.1 ABC transporter permease [Anaerolineales bacterium]
MPKLFVVAQEEINFHLRQWSFYVSLLAIPILFAAVGALPRLRSAAHQAPLPSVETVFDLGSEELKSPVGVVDQAGLIQDFTPFQPYTTELTAAAALSRGDIDSYYVIPAGYLNTGQIVQYSQNPQLLSDSDAAVRGLLRDNLIDSLNDPGLTARFDTPVKLVRQGPPPPLLRFAPANLDLNRLVAAGLVVGLFVYLLGVGGHLLIRALQREVKAHVLEVIVVSTTPAQFIGGKLLGLLALILLQAGLALIAGMLVYGQNPDGSGPAALPLQALLLSLPYLLLGFLGYCALLMGIAALWPTLQESTLLLGGFRLLSLLPLIGGLFILPDRNSGISMALTFLPLTSHLLMPFRLLLGAVPGWQWVTGLLILSVWTVVWLWLSMRLFRLSSLLTGRFISLKLIWQAMWR